VAQQYQVDIVTKVVGASSVTKLERSIQNLSNEQNKVDKASLKAANGIKTFDRAAKSAASGTAKLKGSVNGVIGSLSKLAAGFIGAYTAVRLFNAAITATGDRASAEQRLKNLTSSTGEYETALLAAKVASQRFGVTQTEATQALGDTLSRLSGLGYGLKEVNDIYTGFNTIARQSGVAAEDAAGAFLQLSQALGSGTLQGDELRSILERMPQLGVAIQEALGPEGAGKSIKQLGSEGKLSGDVILEALTKAASGADNLGGKISQQQLTFESLRQAADRVFVAFGQAFGPMILSAVDQIVFAMGFMGSLLEQAAGFAQANATALGNFAAVALRLGAVVGVIVAVVKAVQLVKKALDAARNAQIAFMALAGPKAWAVIAGGIAVAAATTYALAEANKAVDQAMTDAATKAEENGQLMVQKLQEQIQLYSRQNDEGQKNIATKAQEAAATKALAAAQREYQAALSTEQGDIDRKLQVTQALAQEEQKILDLQLQQATGQLDAAQTQQDRVAAARKVYEIEVKLAEVAYSAAIAAIAAELEKFKAALKHAQVLEQQVQAEVALQRMKGIVNEKQKEALRQAREVVETAKRNLAAQHQIADALSNGAAATRDKAVEAAKVKMEMAAQTQQQNQTNAAISQGANEMSRLANEAQRAASASAGIGGGGGGGGGGSGTSMNYGPQLYDEYVWDSEKGKPRETTRKEREQQVLRQKMAYTNQKRKQIQAFDKAFAGTDYSGRADAVWKNGGMIGLPGSQMYNEFMAKYGSWMPERQIDPNMLNTFADGGYVTGPQQAIVGEGGEPEYIIPASKLDGAMQRYSAGMRGESMIPSSASVSVNYSGSTVDMGGSSYINKGDVTGIVSQAVNQTLTTLQRSSRARLTAGLR
jgi:tape measure domain-containing protein